MSTGVSAIVVARRSARELTRTLEALAAQSRPARTVVVDASRDDGIRAAARAAEPDFIIGVASTTTFGSAVDVAVAELAARAPGSLEGWLWFLEEGDEPDHDALAHLLATVERNPSVEVTGPKLVRTADETVIVELGQTSTSGGEKAHLHRGELDQGQFDDASDVLAVARNGLLIRAMTWRDLGGFDPGLADVDDDLDLGARTWLSDGRVVVTPQARLRVPARPEPSRRARRTGQLHRLVASAGPGEWVLRRAALIPIAIVGIFWNLVRKRPGRIFPDLAAAFDVAFGRTHVGAARRHMVATTTQPPRVVERLLLSGDDRRRDRAVARDERRIANRDERERYALVGTGGAWVLLAAAIVSVVLMLPILGRSSLAGGGLLPLSATVGELWSNVGYGVRDAASGAFGVADPFALVLALLGTATFWHPSTSIVVLWVLAMPLAALSAWYLAARLTVRPWLRAFTAFAWMLAPPFVSALADGRIQTVIVHILLPLLFFCGLRGARTWTGVAQASLVAAAILACAPSLWPVLLLLWLIALVAGGRHWYRQLFLVVPALALFTPLALAQWNRGRPYALFADPGVPVAADPVRGAALGLGFPDTSLGGWAGIVTDRVAGVDVAVVLAAALLPLAMLAALGLVLPAWRVAAWSTFLALTGLVWAAVTGSVSLVTLGPESVALSTGPAQSLCVFGLIGAALAGLAVASRLALSWSVVALVGVGILVAPAAVSHVTGTSIVDDGGTRALPAIVEAEARDDDAIATMIVTPLADDSLRVRLDRGIGETLDEQSTLRATAADFSGVDTRLAELAVTLVSSTTTAPTGELHALGIAFVLVEDAGPEATSIASRLTLALDSNPTFEAAGSTANGTVWRIVNPTVAPADENVAGPLGVGNVDTWIGRAVLAALALALLTAVVLALPTGAPPARPAAASMAAGPRRRHLTVDPPDRPGARRFGAPEADDSVGVGYDDGDAEGQDGRK